MDWRELPDWYDPAAKHDIPAPTHVETVEPTANYSNPVRSANWDGGKYPGGFGVTNVFRTDHYTLRLRSDQLFRENLYARGMIRRLVTNIIHNGLHPESMAEESVLGLGEGELNGWKESNERRFELYANSPQVCDYSARDVFGEIQRTIKREAIVSGDVLVVLHLSPITGMPQVQVINGAHVRTPSDQRGLRKGNKIVHGVELDSRKRHVAFWVVKEDNTHVRIPAWGSRSGRRVAWLYYGNDRRLDDVRGEPLLSLILQSLKEVDRYRDAAQRKATINSILAMFIKKTKPKMGTKPVTGGAVRRREVTPDTPDGDRKFNILDYLPGTVIEELQEGEEPVPHSTAGTDVNFGEFEEAVINACAWANGIPPTIYRLGFNRNYAASQGEINEFKIFLSEERFNFGNVNCAPVWQECLISKTLMREVNAPGLIDAWRNPALYEQYMAWVYADWTGAVKPATDLLKLVNAYEKMVDRGWMTNDLATRELTGTKFSQNVRRLKAELRMLSDAGVDAEPGTDTGVDARGLEAV